MEIYGEMPRDAVVFAACDIFYFKEHGPSFVYSLNDIDKDVHIHVVNPNNNTYGLACILQATTDVNVTFSFNCMDFTNWTPEAIRTYYACLRFLVAPTLLVQNLTHLLVSDIDCVFMKDFKYPDAVCGYFPREPLPGTTGWEKEGTRVAAGAVYFHKSAASLAYLVAKSISEKPLNWFVDQIALSEVLGIEKDAHHFDSSFLDWEFEEDTVIWTGKGPRKYENKTYVDKKNKFNRVVHETSKIDHVILKPRLDCPFKNLGMFVRTKNIQPIRVHWANFVDKLSGEIRAECGKSPLIVEMPRWMLNNTIEEFFGQFTKFYVPHVEKHNFGGGDNTQYYMQTVFPWLFTLDHQGWGGGASFVNAFDPTDSYTTSAFDKMREYALEGNSKFAQPQKRCRGWDNYIFVPLQLPHDETITWHSDISVEDFVYKLCEWTMTHNKPDIIFKGHPVNLSSMLPLKQIIDGYKKCSYVTDIHIHDLIEDSIAVYVINSGVGQEAMLFDKPVVSFGRSEYQGAVINGDIDRLDSVYAAVNSDDIERRKALYRRWYHWYINKIVKDTR